jgi:hypothetical protein
MADEDEWEWTRNIAVAAGSTVEGSDQLAPGALIEVGFPGVFARQLSQTSARARLLRRFRRNVGWGIWERAWHPVKPAGQIPVKSICAQKSSETAMFRIDRDFPQRTCCTVSPDSVFVGAPRQHVAGGVRIIEIYQAFPSPKLEHGGVNLDAVVDQSTDDIPGGSDGPICGAKYVTAVGGIYRLQKRLKKLLPEPDEFIQAAEA